MLVAATLTRRHSQLGTRRLVGPSDIAGVAACVNVLGCLNLLEPLRLRALKMEYETVGCLDSLSRHCFQPLQVIAPHESVGFSTHLL